MNVLADSRVIVNLPYGLLCCLLIYFFYNFVNIYKIFFDDTISELSCTEDPEYSIVLNFLWQISTFRMILVYSTYWNKKKWKSVKGFKSSVFTVFEYAFGSAKLKFLIDCFYILDFLHIKIIFYMVYLMKLQKYKSYNVKSSLIC